MQLNQNLTTVVLCSTAKGFELRQENNCDVTETITWTPHLGNSANEKKNCRFFVSVTFEVLWRLY